jgi:hypothetical protein
MFDEKKWPVSHVEMLRETPNLISSEGWVANLDSITEKIVGGSFCRRASQFSATSIPNNGFETSINDSLTGIQFWPEV